LKTQHERWYPSEAISVGIGQGAVTVTPLQLARALGGIASGGVLKRPHVVFPDELPPEMVSAIESTFPGSGDRVVPITPENWETITDAMTEVMGPGGTAGMAHLEDVDFAGKTGTAQVMSHAALARFGGGHKTVPNAWFVGMAPRRNPDIVVAVLLENGDWGWHAAQVAAQVVSVFVNKQRKHDANLRIVEAPKPAANPAPNAAPNPDGVPTASATPAVRPGAANAPAGNRP
jgi:penicillin-binding protein 2